MKKCPPIDFTPISTYSISLRDNKVNIRVHFATDPWAGGRFAHFYASLPRPRGFDTLRGVVDAVVTARQADRPVVPATGGT